MDFVDQEGNDLNTSFTYRTLPGTGCSDRNIKIAIGGDVGFTQEGKELTSNL
jgi:hypothetical protein